MVFVFEKEIGLLKKNEIRVWWDGSSVLFLILIEDKGFLKMVKNFDESVMLSFF